MERVATIPTKVCFRILGAVLLLFQDGTESRMMANARGQLTESGSHEQGWGDPLSPRSDVFTTSGCDCFDPPPTPLPPCDFNHQKGGEGGFDCWPKDPPATRTVTMDVMHDGNSSARASHVLAQGWGDSLPPCGGLHSTPGFDCFDPPSTPLPPCDFKHQRVGFDCWPQDHLTNP